jgi:hypothetical protein
MVKTLTNNQTLSQTRSVISSAVDAANALYMFGDIIALIHPIFHHKVQA